MVSFYTDTITRLVIHGGYVFISPTLPAEEIDEVDEEEVFEEKAPERASDFALEGAYGGDVR